jgi:hypothetical protein
MRCSFKTVQNGLKAVLYTSVATGLQPGRWLEAEVF